MTVAVNDLVDKAELVLQDSSNVRWTASELVGWLNDGQRQAVILKPDVSVNTSSVQLTSGTKQAVPSDGIVLLDVTRNMGTDGTTPGTPIRIIDRKIIDAMVPTWHTESAAVTVKHFVFDPRNPLVYFVYPQSDGTNYVELVYSVTPAIVSAGENIVLADVYESVLLDYILFRAYSKDADYAANAELALAHYTAFFNTLTQKDAVEIRNEPRPKG